MASVTLTLTTVQAGAGNFTIYHTSIDPGNIIATGVSKATMNAGFCTEEIHNTYWIKSNTAECTNSTSVSIPLIPTATPTATAFPTSTPGPTSTPTSTPIFYPTPTPTSTAGPTATPFPTSTPGGPTPTPTTSPTATPTPTATALPGVYSLQISDGAQNQNRCLQPLVATVYASASFDTWTEYGQRVYTDPTLTTGFDGGNYYYRFASGSVSKVFSVNASGLVSEEGQTCGTVYSFSGSAQTNLNDDPCSKPLNNIYYTYDFNTVTNITTGSVIYQDDELTVQLSDNYKYAISDATSATTARDSVTGTSFNYSLISGVNNIDSCQPSSSIYYGSSPSADSGSACNFTAANTYYLSTPLTLSQIVDGTRLYLNSGATSEISVDGKWIALGYNPSPATGEIVGYYTQAGGLEQIITCNTPPPPTFVYPISASTGTTSEARCTANLIQVLYSNSKLEEWTEYGQQVFTDEALTQPYDGLSRFHRFETGSATGDVNRVFSVNPYGWVHVEGQICGTPTAFSGSSAANLNEDPCIDPLNQIYYSVDFTSVLDMQEGDVIYTDASLTTQLADNFLFSISDNPGSTSRAAGGRSFKYSLIYGVRDIETCNPTSSFYYGTSFFNQSTGVCNYTTPNLYYLSQPLAIDDISLGTRFYQNAAATVEITADDQYFAIGYNSSPNTGEYVIGYTQDAGVVSITSCDVPPTEPTIYSMSYSEPGSTSNLQCNAQLTNALYTDTAFEDLNIGTLVYEDADLLTPIQGQSRFHRISSGGLSQVWSINPYGFLHVEGQNCGTGSVYEFYGTNCLLTSEDPCDYLTTRPLYTVDFTSIDNIPAGAQIYTTASLSLELQDSCRIGFATSSGAYSRTKGVYSLISGLQNFQTCSAPPPAPTATPTATPFTVYAVDASATSSPSTFTACNLSLTTTYYATQPLANWSAFTTVIYTDSQGNNTLTGNNQYWKFRDPNTLVEDSWSVNNNGLVSTQNPDCNFNPTPTATPVGPTPTPTPVGFALNRTTPQQFVGIVCGAAATAGVFYTSRSRGLNIIVGDIMYSDSLQTTPFVGGNDYYGVATAIGTTPEREIRVDNNGVVTYAANCAPPPTATPTPTPTPAAVQIYRSNSSYSNKTDACNDTSLIVVYAQKDVNNLQANDYVYTNASLSTPFNGGGNYWSLEAGASSYRAGAIIASDGRIQLISQC